MSVKEQKNVHPSVKSFQRWVENVLKKKNAVKGTTMKEMLGGTHLFMLSLYVLNGCPNFIIEDTIFAKEKCSHGDNLPLVILDS